MNAPSDRSAGRPRRARRGAGGGAALGLLALGVISALFGYGIVAPVLTRRLSPLASSQVPPAAGTPEEADGAGEGTGKRHGKSAAGGGRRPGKPASGREGLAPDGKSLTGAQDDPAGRQASEGAMEPPLSPGKPGPEPADSRTSARKASDPASLERALTDQERARDEQLALERERGTLRARVGKTLGGSPTAEETEPGAQRPPDRKEGALKAEAAPPSQGKHDAAERARKTAERPLPKAPASLKTTPPPGEDPGPGERLGSARPRKEKHALADGTGEKDRAPSRQDPPGASSIPDNGSAEPSSQRYYRVRVGRFKSRKAAEEAREQLFDKTGHGAEVVPVGDDYRLQVGAYEEKSAAQKVAEELRSSEFDADVRNNDGAVVKRRTPPAKRRTRTRTAVKTGAKAGDKE